jgi:hypothetical protein
MRAPGNPHGGLVAALVAVCEGCACPACRQLRRRIAAAESNHNYHFGSDPRINALLNYWEKVRADDYKAAVNAMNTKIHEHFGSFNTESDSILRSSVVSAIYEWSDKIASSIYGDYDEQDLRERRSHCATKLRDNAEEIAAAYTQQRPS